MLFSSPIFLYCFLPITLLIYYLLIWNVKYRNYWLLLTSVIFFAWGGVSYTTILVISILLNYLFGLKIQKNIDSKRGYKWLYIGVATNLALLGVFKYTNFIVYNINDILGFLAIPKVPQSKIILPVGISFYTFHSLSYLVDIYRRKTFAQRNILDLSLYICMFSQLIAGPIIRYSDVWTQLRERTHTLNKFSYGIERFLIGLGKKVLLANVFAQVAENVFTSNLFQLSAPNAWLGMICYSLQIYYDFSGYSDMAIGLGRMFGFEFLENFNFPYIAKSVKEFWRRWHMSLGTFFRDYVYIPLGGNQVKVKRTYINLILVFFLTGFWHGANWTFIVWGLFHGFFMVIERLGFEKILDKIGRPFNVIYTLLVVMFAWVLFRSATIESAFYYWEALFNFNVSNAEIIRFEDYFNLEFEIALVIALLGAFGFFKWIYTYFNEGILNSDKPIKKTISYTYHVTSALFYAAILFFCSMYLIAGTYNPFIYYQF
jgi:alginate O-acetyltransferase complex protein AlgI